MGFMRSGAVLLLLLLVVLGTLVEEDVDVGAGEGKHGAIC